MKYRNKLISTEGTIRRTSNVYNQIKRIAWTCNNCGSDTIFGVNYNDKLNPPKNKCNFCGKQKGYTLNVEKSQFVDMQKFTIQENLEHVQRGFKPAQIEGFLEDAQINTIKPGDKVRVNGIIELRNKDKKNRFKEYILTENIEQLNKEYEDLVITSDDVHNFQEYSKTHDVIEKFKTRIAPNLHGYDEVKEAITLQLFSADTTTNPDGTTSRGDIHILLVGDPGIGKSQILKSVVEIVPRGIYTSGKSSSGAGLTASAVKDESDSWTLEAGAMVLADKGMVCIDEFDKMREEDRSSIHEALEQQTISMAKAGNITTMYSRCSVLAAANPKFGVFNERKTIHEQINLTPTLLSRFDLVFLIRDVKDMDNDAKVALSILKQNTLDQEDDFEYDKYVSYARTHIHPVEDLEASERLVKFYQDWRNTSDVNEDSLIVTSRQFMGLVRLARASARARLSDTVTIDDVERAINLQEYCIRNNGYSVNESTQPMKVVDKLDKLWEKILKLADDYYNKVPNSILMKEASNLGIATADCRQFLVTKDDLGEFVYDTEMSTWSLRDYEDKN